MSRKRLLVLLITTVASLLLVLGLRLPFVESQANPTLLVSAAASLKDSLEEIRSLYQRSQPNVQITYNFGASGTLLQQIENGAPSDIFISAARQQMDALEQKGMLLPGTRRNLAFNRLVLIVPKGSTAIASFNSLRQPGVKRIAIGEPRSVPAGQYAKQVLQNLNLWNDVQSKLILANNVRQVLAVVESGNADAGIVYITDAQISDQVKVAVTAENTHHSPIIYPMAVLKNSKNVNAAKAFVQYLASNEAKGILRKFGFTVK